MNSIESQNRAGLFPAMILIGICSVIFIIGILSVQAGLATAAAILSLGALVILPESFWVYVFFLSIFFARGVSVAFIRNVRLGDVAAVLLLAKWINRIARDGWSYRPATPFLGALAALMAATCCSVINARGQLLVLSGIVQMVEYSLVYLAIADVLWRNPVIHRRLPPWFLSVVGVEIVLGIYQFFHGAPQPDGKTLFRAEGTLDQGLGSYLAVAIAVAAGCYLGTRDRWKRVALVSYAAAAFVCMSLTMARGCMVWLAAAAILTLWLYNRRIALVVALACVSIGVALFFLPLEGSSSMGTHQSPLARVASLLYLLHGEQNAYGNWTVLMRFELWREGLLMFKTHPIVGVGSKNFFLYIIDFATPLVWKMRETLAEGYGVLSPHNQYICTLAETGLLGMTALLFLCWKNVRLATQMLLARIGEKENGTAVASFLASTYFWFSGISGEFFFGYTGLFFVGILAWLSVERKSRFGIPKSMPAEPCE